MPATPPVHSEAALEREFIFLFEELADLFGNPRSLGTIYGLLFWSPTPLSMEEIVARLGVSKGTASQGLRQLEHLGAIRRTKEEHSRTHTYQARMELKPLIAGFLQSRVIPRLTAGNERLAQLKDMVAQLPEPRKSEAEVRLQRITQWHKRGASVLPFVQRLLQGT